jgi:hypothetical protein
MPARVRVTIKPFSIAISLLFPSGVELAQMVLQ